MEHGGPAAVRRRRFPGPARSEARPGRPTSDPQRLQHQRTAAPCSNTTEQHPAAPGSTHLAVKAHQRVQQADGDVGQQAVAAALKHGVRQRAQHDVQVAVLACSGQAGQAGG